MHGRLLTTGALGLLGCGGLRSAKGIWGRTTTRALYRRHTRPHRSCRNKWPAWQSRLSYLLNGSRWGADGGGCFMVTLG